MASTMKFTLTNKEQEGVLNYKITQAGKMSPDFNVDTYLNLSEEFRPNYLTVLGLGKDLSEDYTSLLSDFAVNADFNKRKSDYDAAGFIKKTAYSVADLGTDVIGSATSLLAGLGHVVEAGVNTVEEITGADMPDMSKLNIWEDATAGLQSAGEKYSIANKEFGSEAAKTIYTVVDSASKLLMTRAIDMLAPGVGQGIYWAAMAGDNYSEALNDPNGTQNHWNAITYAALATGLEAVVESASGFTIGKAPAWLTSAINQKLVAKTLVGNIIKNTLIDTLGEASEEMVSEIITPLIQNMTYRQNNTLAGATMDEVLYAGLLGGLTSIAFTGSVNLLTSAVTGVTPMQQARLKFSSELKTKTKELLDKQTELAKEITLDRQVELAKTNEPKTKNEVEWVKLSKQIAGRAKITADLFKTTVTATNAIKDKLMKKYNDESIVAKKLKNITDVAAEIANDYRTYITDKSLADLPVSSKEVSTQSTAKIAAVLKELVNAAKITPIIGTAEELAKYKADTAIFKDKGINLVFVEMNQDGNFKPVPLSEGGKIVGYAVSPKLKSDLYAVQLASVLLENDKNAKELLSILKKDPEYTGDSIYDVLTNLDNTEVINKMSQIDKKLFENLLVTLSSMMQEIRVNKTTLSEVEQNANKIIADIYTKFILALKQLPEDVIARIIFDVNNKVKGVVSTDVSDIYDFKSDMGVTPVTTKMYRKNSDVPVIMYSASLDKINMTEAEYKKTSSEKSNLKTFGTNNLSDDKAIAKFVEMQNTGEAPVTGSIENFAGVKNTLINEDLSKLNAKTASVAKPKVEKTTEIRTEKMVKEEVKPVVKKAEKPVPTVRPQLSEEDRAFNKALDADKSLTPKQRMDQYRKIVIPTVEEVVIVPKEESAKIVKKETTDVAKKTNLAETITDTIVKRFEGKEAIFTKEKDGKFAYIQSKMRKVNASEDGTGKTFNRPVLKNNTDSSYWNAFADLYNGVEYGESFGKNAGLKNDAKSALNNMIYTEGSITDISDPRIKILNIIGGFTTTQIYDKTEVYKWLEENVNKSIDSIKITESDKDTLVVDNLPLVRSLVKLSTADTSIHKLLEGVSIPSKTSKGDSVSQIIRTYLNLSKEIIKDNIFFSTKASDELIIENSEINLSDKITPEKLKTLIKNISTGYWTKTASELISLDQNVTGADTTLMETIAEEKKDTFEATNIKLMAIRGAMLKINPNVKIEITTGAEGLFGFYSKDNSTIYINSGMFDYGYSMTEKESPDYSHSDRNNAVNLIGGIIVHEIGHGIDPEGYSSLKTMILNSITQEKFDSLVSKIESEYNTSLPNNQKLTKENAEAEVIVRLFSSIIVKMVTGSNKIDAQKLIVGKGGKINSSFAEGLGNIKYSLDELFYSFNGRPVGTEKSKALNIKGDLVIETAIVGKMIKYFYEAISRIGDSNIDPGFSGLESINLLISKQTYAEGSARKNVIAINEIVKSYKTLKSTHNITREIKLSTGSTIQVIREPSLLSADMQAMVYEYAAKGISLEFFVDGTSAINTPFTNYGEYQDGRIYVRLQTDRTLEEVAKHEYVHYISQYQPNLMYSLKQLFLTYSIKNLEKVGKLSEIYKKLYPSNQYFEEMISDMVAGTLNTELYSDSKMLKNSNIDEDLQENFQNDANIMIASYSKNPLVNLNSGVSLYVDKAGAKTTRPEREIAIGKVLTSALSSTLEISKNKYLAEVKGTTFSPNFDKACDIVISYIATSMANAKEKPREKGDGLYLAIGAIDRNAIAKEISALGISFSNKDGNPTLEGLALSSIVGYTIKNNIQKNKELSEEYESLFTKSTSRDIDLYSVFDQYFARLLDISLTSAAYLTGGSFASNIIKSMLVKGIKKETLKTEVSAETEKNTTIKVSKADKILFENMTEAEKKEAAQTIVTAGIKSAVMMGDQTGRLRTGADVANLLESNIGKDVLTENDIEALDRALISGNIIEEIEKLLKKYNFKAVEGATVEEVLKNNDIATPAEEIKVAITKPTKERTTLDDLFDLYAYYLEIKNYIKATEVQKQLETELLSTVQQERKDIYKKETWYPALRYTIGALHSVRILTMLFSPITVLTNETSNFMVKTIDYVENTVGAAFFNGGFSETELKIQGKNQLTAEGENIAEDYFGKDPAEPMSLDLRELSALSGKYEQDEKGMMEKIKRQNPFMSESVNKMYAWLMKLYKGSDDRYTIPAYKKYFKIMLSENWDKYESQKDGAGKRAFLDKISEEAKSMALQITFRNVGDFQRLWGKFADTNDFTKFISAALFPFFRTASNITTYVYRHTPVSLAFAVGKLLTYKFDPKQNEFTRAKILKDITSGTLGTVLIGLGMMLASMGLLDIEKDENEYDIGMALRIGKVRISLRSLCPALAPILMGAAVMSGESALSVMDKIFLSVNETTMFGQLDYILKNNRGIVDVLSMIPIQYFSQYTPSLLRAINNITTPYTPKYASDINKRFWQQQWDYWTPANIAFKNNAVKVNPITGQPVTTYGTGAGGAIMRSLANLTPFKATYDKTSEVGIEIQKLKNKGLDVGIQTSDGNITINGKELKLEGKELQSYNQYRGDYINKELKRLFNTDVYKKASTAQIESWISSIKFKGSAYAKRNYTK